jgi:hypothetical protein
MISGPTWCALVAGVQHPAVGGGRLEHARVTCRVHHRSEPAHGQAGDGTPVTGAPVALQQLSQLVRWNVSQRDGVPLPGWYQSE